MADWWVLDTCVGWMLAAYTHAGNLREKYDVLVFVDGAISSGGGFGRGGGAPIQNIPAEYEGRLGNLSEETTGPHLKAFAEAGGSIIAIGSRQKHSPSPWTA